MDGLSRALGSPVMMQLAGSWSLVRPLDLAGLASVEAFLLCQRCTPADAISQAFLAQRKKPSPAQLANWKVLYDKALAEMRQNFRLRSASIEEIQEWISEPAGLAYTAWYCMGRDDPRWGDPGKARKLLRANPDAAETFARVRDAISGMDLLASLDWPEMMTHHPETGKPIKRPAPQRLNWHRLVQQFAEGPGWDLDTIGRMTLYAFKLYTTDPAELPAVARKPVQISAKEARELAKLTPEERKRRVQAMALDAERKHADN